MTKGFKGHWNDFIQFAASQKRGIVWILLLSLGLVFFLPISILFKEEQQQRLLSASEIASIDMLFDKEEELQERFVSEERPEENKKPILFFPFNPNIATPDMFEKLGLNKGQIKYILKRRNKYNGFVRKIDFEKMPILDSAWVSKAHKHILLPDSFEKKAYLKKEFLVFDLNVADSGQLETLPGIGKYMASRIVKYRDRLGGYISTTQMQQITNMDKEIYNIAAPHLCIRQGLTKVNINSASKTVMGNHPYIGWKAANQIINYRKQHKKFVEATELSKAKLLPDSSVKNLLPYISF